MTCTATEPGTLAISLNLKEQQEASIWAASCLAPGSKAKSGRIRIAYRQCRNASCRRANGFLAGAGAFLACIGCLSGFYWAWQDLVRATDELFSGPFGEKRGRAATVGEHPQYYLVLIGKIKLC